MRKHCVLLCAIALTGAVSADVVWKFSPDAVNFSRGTTCEAVKGGWRIVNANRKPEFFSKKTIPVNPKGTYTFLAKLRYVTPGARVWIVTESVSGKGVTFPPTAVSADFGALAAVKNAAASGAKQLILDGADKWAATKSRIVLALNAKADNSDLPNTDYVAVRSVAADGTVELGAPVRRDVAAGTVVRRHFANSPYDTVLSTSLQKFWQEYSASRKGLSKIGRETGQFLFGTAAVRVGIQVEGGDFEIAELSVEEQLPVNRVVTLGPDAKPDLVDKARKGEIETAKLSWWGVKADDATDILQDAIDSKVKKLIIDKMPSPWITEPVLLRGDLEIVFESGATVEAKRGAYKRYHDSVFSSVGEDNIIIRGEGEGGVIRMHKTDYQDPRKYIPSESRHCVKLQAGHHLRVENMHLLNSGGDGLCIFQSGTKFPEHVVLRKLNCDGNHRQGISIINGRHILIEECKLSNTDGTMPMAGIDIETNHSNEPTADIVVRNCEIVGNTGAGIQVSVTRMDTRITGPVDITFENCLVKDNKQADLFIWTRTRWERLGHELKGNLRFVNCKFESDFPNASRRYPVEIEMDTRHELNISFADCTLKRSSGGPETFRIAFCDPDGQPPAAKIDLSGLKMSGVPKGKELLVFDHSYLGDTSWLKGIDYKPKSFKNPAPWQGGELPIKYEVKTREFPRVPEFWRAGWWVYGHAGDTAEFELDYIGLGRISSRGSVTWIAPSGKTTRLEDISPVTVKKYRIKLEEDGFHRIDVHGERVYIALKSSNLPAGILADPHARSFFQFEGDIYFHVPENAPEFAVRAWGRSNLLFVAFEIYDPSGNKVFDVPCASGAQFDPTPEQRKKAGIWRLRLKKPTRGYFAKCHVAFPGLPPYLGIIPEMMPGN